MGSCNIYIALECNQSFVSYIHADVDKLSVFLCQIKDLCSGTTTLRWKPGETYYFTYSRATRDGGYGRPVNSLLKHNLTSKLMDIDVRVNRGEFSPCSHNIVHIWLVLNSRSAWKDVSSVKAR